MPLPEAEHQINRLSMREEVYDKLLTWIMEGTLRPGEKLLDKELADTLGVSRTPVREALRRLEDKGLVESSASRWTRVSEISHDDPGMIYPIIWTLEALAAEMAIFHLTENDYKRMEKANAALKSALEKGDPVAASAADARFHDVYIQRSYNGHLINILQDLKIKYRRMEINYFEKDAKITASLEDHARIITAFKHEDTPLATNIIRSNWQNSLKRLMHNSGGAPGVPLKQE